MARYAWNHNGKNDIFDRFVDYQRYKHFAEKDASIFDDDDDDWRNDCEDGSEYGIDPEDYETEDEYIDALDEAELEAEEIEEPDYLNKRRYNAVVRLVDIFTCYNDKRIERFKFILEKGDTILAANYLTPDGKFLYAQAVKDHFTLPINLSDEDEVSECDFDEMIYLIAEENTSLSLEVWDWCLEQFLPYAQYGNMVAESMTNYVINRLDDFPVSYVAELVRYMHQHSEFRFKVAKASSDIAFNFPKVIVAAIEKKFFTMAKELFVNSLEKAIEKEEEIIALIEAVYRECMNDNEFQTMKYFANVLLPLVNVYGDEVIQEKMSGWKKDIAVYMAGEYRGKTRKKQLGKPVYTYCGVTFQNKAHIYSYRTDDASIKVGDTVIVPVGREDIEEEAQVVFVGQYAESAVPYPVEKTKYILRKCDEETKKK